MAQGCTDPRAVNYDSEADESTPTCIYVDNVGGTCYGFQELDPEDITDKSLTLSFGVEGDNWIFFHDYIPDFYFSTRDKLHTLMSGKVYTHNSGEPGKYYGETKPFFVDMVFKLGQEGVLNSLKWVTEVFDRVTENNEEFSTLSHITIWNSWQTTGRIPLSSVFATLETNNVAKSRSEWNFNDFRDLVATRGTKFIGDLFDNFAVDPNALNPNLPWYEQKLLEDEYFIVRLEFDNSANKDVILHDVDIDVTKSYR